ncbi:MAG: glycosyltransferase [Anaerolineales bacterium]|jgi:trehalose synthase
MSSLLNSYAEITGETVIEQLRQLADILHGASVVHVNSTRVGGGVAEILDKLIPLMRELGLETRWEVITGDPEFYQCTKSFHNALQGNPIDIPANLLNAYERTNRENAETLRPVLEEADFVIIHDPQPAMLHSLCPDKKGKWVWRCHIDLSRPYRRVWKYLMQYVRDYDASIFSLAAFARALPHAQFLIAPSIDPLSDKNCELDQDEIADVQRRFEIDPSRPMILQVSRFDRFKDPVGVIQAYRLAKQYTPTLQLVLAGGTATDDPEGDVVLQEVRAAAGDDPDLKVLLLPPDAHRTINALQRAADIVLQKSVKEGFGLTVTEAMLKAKPVIGGNVGGIRIQVVDHHTGFLVDTPEGAALRIRQLLQNRAKLDEMGQKARRFAMENFLITRHLRDYLALMVSLRRDTNAERLELG